MSALEKEEGLRGSRPLCQRAEGTASSEEAGVRKMTSKPIRLGLQGLTCQSQIRNGLSVLSLSLMRGESEGQDLERRNKSLMWKPAG